MSDHVPNQPDRTLVQATLNSSRGRALGFAGFAIALLWCVQATVGLRALIEPKSLAISIGAPCALLLGVFGWDRFRLALPTLRSRYASPRDAADARAFFRLGALFAIGCGFLGTLMALLAVLMNLDDPAEVGPALAMTMFSQLYGVLFAVMLMAAGAAVDRRTQTVASDDYVDNRSIAIAGLVTGVGSASVIGAILLVSLTLQATG